MSNEIAELTGVVQRNEQPAAPNEEIATAGTGPDNEAQHRPDGRFTPGNVAALRHGGRSRRVQAGLMPEQAEARAALSERVSAIVRDLGGADSLSALAVGQVQRHARLELVDGFLWSNLQQHGPLTGKGRTRACLTAWLSVVDRLQKSALALGLERRPKRVPTIAEYFKQRQDETARTQQPAAEATT